MSAQIDLEDVTGRSPKNESVAADRLRSLVERIERLTDEKKGLSEEIKDVFARAKFAGYDVKVLRELIRIRRKDPAELEEQESLLDVYRAALGMR